MRKHQRADPTTASFPHKSTIFLSRPQHTADGVQLPRTITPFRQQGTKNRYQKPLKRTGIVRRKSVFISFVSLQ